MGINDFFQALRSQHPGALKRPLKKWSWMLLPPTTTSFVDDAHLLLRVVGGSCHFYQRSGLMNAPLTTLASCAAAAGKKLIFGLDGSGYEPLRLRGHLVAIPDFEPADYAHLYLLNVPLVNPGRGLDSRKLYRFSRELNGHHFKALEQWIRGQDERPDTDGVIEYLRTHRLASNVDLGEVQPVEFD